MYQKLYQKWLKEVKDYELINELNEIKNDNNQIKDRFYKSLEFGTAGLRGIIGAGTNRMNIYTVAQATQGLAEYVKSINKNGKVAIAYDCRINSDVFAKKAASVLAANGIHVYIYKELMPTPTLSFAVRYLKCDAGIVITASHNPSKYNGYKAYGSDGCQLGLKESDYVTKIINSVDIFNDVKTIDFNEALSNNLIEFISDDIINEYINCVKKQSCIDNSYNLDNLKVIYTPLHGTGNKPVRTILEKIGIKNLKIVKEQEQPNGLFPTVRFPNPEFKEAFDIAIKYTENFRADIIVATDPDSDRVGIAVLHENDYILLNGNEIGVLLLEYLLKRKTELGILPKNPVAIKTIVSTELCKPICHKYNCNLIDVLTGFKFIGEQIYLLEKENEDYRFIFGFEESYGYLSGSYVRDKDAVIGAMLLCEMASYYKSKSKDLITVLEDIYQEYGYYYNMQHSITCEGIDGMSNIAKAMIRLRNNPLSKIGNFNIVKFNDYENSNSYDLIENTVNIINLPKSNVLSYTLNNKTTITVRPSGTEPKIKVYISAVGNSSEEAIKIAQELKSEFLELLNL